MPINQLLTSYESKGRHGLLCGAEVALPARYDAVWAMPYGFWGFRRGKRFGVLTAGGQLVCRCELPARLHGFAELTVEEELAAFLEPEGSYVPFMRRQYPELYHRHWVLCRPATWLAEEVMTPAARPDAEEADEDDGLWLHAADYTLHLQPNGSWQRHDWPGDVLLYAEQSGHFRTVLPGSFHPAEIGELLRWRLRMRELSEPGINLLAESSLGWLLADAQQCATCLAELTQMLQASGISGLAPAESDFDPNQYPEFDYDSLSPDARAACEAHLNTIFDVDADSRELVEQLVYLAWLWANDFVGFDPEDGLHWVVGPYEFDNSLFDNTVIDNIYRDYELDALRPWLRLAAD